MDSFALLVHKSSTLDAHVRAITRAHVYEAWGGVRECGWMWFLFSPLGCLAQAVIHVKAGGSTIGAGLVENFGGQNKTTAWEWGPQAESQLQKGCMKGARGQVLGGGASI